MAGFDLNDAQSRPARPDPLIGRVLAGRYEIRRLLGEGGMGRVYEGRQRALDRAVAVKCIHPHLLSSEQMVMRFMDEARVVSQLVHPNVVKIYDFGRTDPPDAPTFFIVMELLTGPDLASVLASSAPLPLSRTHSILRQILGALGEAHSRGVTHRDAKPENVILEPGGGRLERAKLIDFGIAKVHGVRGHTAIGQFVGTPYYMPPEQIRGEGAEVSSDLYAVAVTLFQMLTGRLPFEGGTVTEVLEKQLYAKRPDPREVAPHGDCTPELAQVVLRALDVDPRQRYLTADAFAEALDDAVSHVLPPQSRRSTYPPASRTLGGAAPSRRSDPAGATVVVEPEPVTIPPRSGTRGIPAPEGGAVDIFAAERIERAADAEIARGRVSAAIVELTRGLELGARWLGAGELEIGRSALSVFGRRLGAMLRDQGRLADSERTLMKALAQTEHHEIGRARILAELVATLVDAGRPVEAESYRIEALRVASAEQDRSLVARLRRLAQSLALSAVSRGATSEPPPVSSGIPAPRRSEWRFRADMAETPEELARRRR